MDSRYLQDKEELKQPRREIDEDRRSFLTAGLVGGAVAAGTLAAGMAHAQQVAQAPALSDKVWWPHPKWGKDDQAGASNYMTPAKVLDTVKLIKDGKVYASAASTNRRCPSSASAPSRCASRAAHRRSVRRQQADLQRRVSVHRDRPDGTQFDGLAHIGIQMGKTATRARCATTTASPIRK